MSLTKRKCGRCKDCIMPPWSGSSSSRPHAVAQDGDQPNGIARGENRGDPSGFRLPLRSLAQLYILYIYIYICSICILYMIYTLYQYTISIYYINILSDYIYILYKYTLCVYIYIYINTDITYICLCFLLYLYIL